MATIRPAEWYERVFGHHLHKHASDTPVPIDTIINTCEVVGVYFTGDTSSEVTGDTSQVTAMQILRLYKSVNKGDDVRKRMEVIQLGGDQETADVPWYEMDGEKKVRLLRRYGAPDPLQERLLLLDSFSGDVITSTGLERLQGDPEGEMFPWVTRNIAQILQDARFVNSQGEEIPYKQFQDKVKGFYFSAHWCPPCRAFTPQLIDTYQSINKKEQQLEVIMVSSDRSPESFNTYLCNMPWLAVSYEQDNLRRELAELFEVGGIPTLVLLDANNQLITSEGRAEVNEDPQAQNFPWRPKLVNLMTERYATKLHETPAVVIFVEGDDDEILFAETALQAAAKEQASATYNQLLFLIGCDGDVSDRLREFVAIDDTVPLVALVDIPGNRFATLEDGVDITEESLKTFVRSFREESLIMTTIRQQSAPIRATVNVDSE